MVPKASKNEGVRMEESNFQTWIHHDAFMVLPLSMLLLLNT
jgi:hypothetical protein